MKTQNTMIRDYLYTLGKYLGIPDKEEILQEVESNILDYLEQQFGTKGYSVGETEQALKALGHPREVAKGYSTESRGLISEAHIDNYWLIIKIASVAGSISMVFTLMLSPELIQHPLQLVIQSFVSIWQTILTVFGLVTLIFIGLNRVLNQTRDIRELSSVPEDWSISDLESEPVKRDLVSRTEVGIETFFSILGIAFLNQLFPSFGNNLKLEGVVLVGIDFQLLAPYVIWINLVLGAGILLNGILLVQGKWNKALRIVSTGLSLLVVVFAYIILINPGTMSAESLSQMNSGLVRGIQIGLRTLFAGIVIATAFELYGHGKALWVTSKG